MNSIQVDETKLWNAPYSTPMINDVYQWAMDLIVGGHTGGVIYAPTRTGKTKLIELLVEDLMKFYGPRGNLIESATAWVVTQDRLVMSEGGFWDWLLHQFNHQSAGIKKSPLDRRRLVAEYLKSVARRCPSGRLVMFVDEAQLLELTELGWFADLFNSFQQDGFEMVLFLVGSYHLREWIKELLGQRHEHVRSRFFTKEHRLTGLKTFNHFQRCLRRFDVDKRPFNEECSFTGYYLPEWFAAGGRLEKRADLFLEGFKAMSTGKHFEVPMAYFVRAVRNVFNSAEQDCDLERFKIIVRETGFTRINMALEGMPA